MGRIFISHSTNDTELAIQLIDFLKNKGLKDSEIRVSSVPGFALPAGKSLSQQIRQFLQEVDVVVAIISKDSLSSNWLQFEIGAAWGLGKRVIPILVGDTSFEDIPPTISGFQALRVDTKDDFVKAAALISEIADE